MIRFAHVRFSHFRTIGATFAALLPFSSPTATTYTNLKSPATLSWSKASIAFSTAFQNDNNPALVFAQQVNAYGQKGDVLVVFSTSGNSKNCIYATICAKAKGMKVVTLTGGMGGKLAPMSDTAIIVPAKETYQVQEYHLPVYHCLCAMLEEHRGRCASLPGGDELTAPTAFVFGGSRPVPHSSLDHAFERAIAKAGVKPIRIHDLRHSCASLLVAQGVQMKLIQQWLGHSNISTMANIIRSVPQ